jgi:hypothetical protein
VKISTTIALALAAALSSSLAAYAQTEQPAFHKDYHVDHYYAPHHKVQHHSVPHNLSATSRPTAVVAGPPPAAPQPAPLGLSWPHIAPYPDGKGDEDGLSGDENDCNKGCIDGNAPD